MALSDFYDLENAADANLGAPAGGQLPGDGQPGLQVAVNVLRKKLWKASFKQSVTARNLQANQIVEQAIEGSLASRCSRLTFGSFNAQGQGAKLSCWAICL